jgi:hypothetical protein
VKSIHHSSFLLNVVAAAFSIPAEVFTLYHSAGILNAAAILLNAAACPASVLVCVVVTIHMDL